LHLQSVRERLLLILILVHARGAPEPFKRTIKVLETSIRQRLDAIPVATTGALNWLTHGLTGPDDSLSSANLCSTDPPETVMFTRVKGVAEAVDVAVWTEPGPLVFGSIRVVLNLDHTPNLQKSTLAANFHIVVINRTVRAAKCHLVPLAALMVLTTDTTERALHRLRSGLGAVICLTVHSLIKLVQ